MSYIFTFTPKDSFNSKEMMEDLSSQADVQTVLKGNIGESMTVEFKLTNSLSGKQRLYSYYHKVVLNVAMQHYKAMGYYEADKVFCDYMLKSEVAKDIVYNELTGEEEVFLLDKSRMNKNRLSQFVTDCIAFLEVECGCTVPDSASYVAELQTGIKGFTSVNSKKSD